MLSRPIPSALQAAPELYVRQVRELAELFGVETRNKYAITTSDRQEVAFAAEQQKGLLGLLLRQVLGHWRPFEVHFFGADRQPFLRAVHPFRFLFRRLEVFDSEGRQVGALEQRFSLFSKRFDVQDSQGNVLLEVKSGLFRPWSFPFFRGETEVAIIEKKWSGALTELFMDKDNFRIRFQGALSPEERLLVFAAAVFVDLQYFERKE